MIIHNMVGHKWDYMARDKNGKIHLFSLVPVVVVNKWKASNSERIKFPKLMEIPDLYYQIPWELSLCELSSGCDAYYDVSFYLIDEEK